MGIVAFCPNGHRIKVKDELAGRKGICPMCATRFRIPRKTSPANAPADAPADVPADVPADTTAARVVPMARVVSLDPRLAASLPSVDPLEHRVAARAGGEPDLEAAEDVPDFTAVVPEPAPAAVAAAHAVLAERPDVPWCYAVRGGAPSAAVTAATLRAWLDSGAATVDHVVWRADWPDWRPLADVFPDALRPWHRG